MQTFSYQKLSRIGIENNHFHISLGSNLIYLHNHKALLVWMVCTRCFLWRVKCNSTPKSFMLNQYCLSCDIAHKAVYFISCAFFFFLTKDFLTSRNSKKSLFLSEYFLLSDVNIFLLSVHLLLRELLFYLRFQLKGRNCCCLVDWVAVIELQQFLKAHNWFLNAYLTEILNNCMTTFPRG